MKTTFVFSILLVSVIMAGSCNNPSGTASAQTQTTQNAASTAEVIPVSLASGDETPAAVSRGAVESINAAKVAGKPVFHRMVMLEPFQN